jgi:PIN domain nuclease of toxin-antitoxin system
MILMIRCRMNSGLGMMNKYLLDTHTFLWWESNADQLSATAFALLSDRTNMLLFSIANIWEMQIKVQIGKLKLNLPLEEMVTNQVSKNQLILLPVLFPHVLELDKLPAHHRDPFDRLLVAQALFEDATIISRDSEIIKYPAPVIW